MSRIQPVIAALRCGLISLLIQSLFFSWPLRLGTKLMRLVNDRGRLERLAAGGANGPEHSSRVRVAEMEEMVEDLQEKVRALQNDNEGLKRRLHMTRQQLISKLSRRPSPYDHIQPRINTGVKNLRSSPHPRPKSQLKSIKSGPHSRGTHSHNTEWIFQCLTVKKKGDF